MSSTLHLTPQSGAAALQLTPMEERVLDAMRIRAEKWYAWCVGGGWDEDIDTDAQLIVAAGRSCFGDHWYGPFQNNKWGRPNYPVINTTLGRLVKKGLVQRTHNTTAAMLDRSFSSWRLTAEGWNFLGLPPMPPNTPFAHYST